MQILTTRLIALVLLLTGIAAGYFALPGTIAILPDVPYRLGLDLQGGTHLVYEADVSSIPSIDVDESMAGLRDVIERRVNTFGVAEPVVQVEEAGADRRLIVELAGVRDIAQAIHMIGETPFLEFRAENPDSNSAENEQVASNDYFIPTDLTGKYLKRADVAFGQSGIQPLVTLSFDDEGSRLFEDLTEQNIGKQLAIFLDGFPISAPVVQQKITGGQAQITGDFSVEEARELVRRFRFLLRLFPNKVWGHLLEQKRFRAVLPRGYTGLLPLCCL
jgi:preprotein translocase subunit SecD